MKIYVNGGLGNQLFQYSYGHSTDKSIEMYLDTFPREDRPFDLQELILVCKHKTFICSTNKVLLKLRIRFSKIPVKFNLPPLSYIFSRLTRVVRETKPFTINSFDRKQNGSIHVGYFQHWKNVENSWELFGPELISYIESIKFPENLNHDLQKTILIHIRQGDLVTVTDTMGVLDSGYYSNSISLIMKNHAGIAFDIVVVTDDVSRAKDVINNEKIDNFFIYGPEDLSAWQTLKLLSGAKFIVSANSTLSWWGAYIASKQGGFVVFPDPWFKNWHEQVGTAFYFPGAKTEKSYFMN